ncbi:mechanosensitive ion channel family protein [Pseudomonadota bacterium]
MLEELFKETGKYIDWSEWAIQVFIVVFCTLLLDFFLKRLLNRMQRQVEKTTNPWDDALLSSVRRPLSVLVWVVGLTFAASIVDEISDAAIFSAIIPLRDVGVVTVIAWFLLRFIRAAQNNIIAHRLENEIEIDHTTVDAIGKLLRISVVITAVLVGLQTLGFSISGVLAFGGIGGIAIGFAAKDLLANFFGGLMIYLDRPFSVGEWIRSPDREIEGVVEHIGWRQTRIRTFDKRPLYVPNSVFANIGVENPSRMSHRRIYETIGIRYDDAAKMSAITADVKQMLLAHPEIDTTQTMIVNFNSFAPSSMDFFVYTFTKTTEWIKFHEIKHDVLLKINEIVASHDAELAFPTSTLHFADAVKPELNV